MTKYTKAELQCAKGTDIVFNDPDQVWINFTKKGIGQSHGRIVEVFNNQLSVFDIPRNGLIRILDHNIVAVPFIDAIKETELYHLLEE